MAGRLTRFLNLERPRKGDETPPHEVATRARFGNAGEAGEAVFRAEREAQLCSGLQVEDEHAGEQPFLRCPLCEADNTRYAEKCHNCQGRLDTPSVREWNARFWEARRAQEAALPLQPPPPTEEQQRQLGMFLAEQVAQRERARLGWDGRDSTPLGIRLLAEISDEKVRSAVSLGLWAVFLGSAVSAYLFRSNPMLQFASICVAATLLGLFTPVRRGSRWWDPD